MNNKVETDMKRPKNYLWLEGIFDEDTIKSFVSTSPAVSFWQRGFVDALNNIGSRVDVIGYPAERVWPFGRLSIRSEQASLSPGLKGKTVGYINTLFLRDKTQYMNFLKVAKHYFKASENRPDYAITFSCLDKPTDETPSMRVAKYIREKYAVPWICIVGDGAAPPGADGYVYQNWTYYHSGKAPGPSVHIDGGIPRIKPGKEPTSGFNPHPREKALMYMGALTQHGGCTPLARAFHALPDEDIRLWICGRGENTELERLAEIDKRIIIKGFVSELELNKLARSAFAFANPRPNSFVPNKLNYPSKILHYLAYGKPIISTFTDGIDPAYSDVLIPILEDTENGLSVAIQNSLKMTEEEYIAMCAHITNFNETHTWEYQIDRFSSWLSKLK